jgi:hypothetical protein
MQQGALKLIQPLAVCFLLPGKKENTSIML